MLTFLITLLLLAATSVALPQPYQSQPFAKVVRARQAPTNGTGLEVDLGYSIYQGVANASTNLNVFKGIRFAAAPTGSLRWQAPQTPPIDRAAPIPAASYAPQCPQGPLSTGQVTAVNESLSSEDCLFLNVYSPNNVTGPLPVLVWIHGGGYGAGNGQLNFANIINTNGNGFIGVSIQYRLAALGFLSSDELYRNGVVNAGILDQHFALQWVQQYISQFNGDPSRVTISGESAGGGSTMLQAMAFGGSIGESLFTNVISASPYLPMQYRYSDWVPTQSYYALAAETGCLTNLPYGGNSTSTIFKCLQNLDMETLVNGSATVSQQSTYGTWAFLPVTDDVFVQDTPSRQLLRKKVNGLNVLSGNNANEGPLFVPRTIKTEDDLVSWLRLTFPLFSTNDIAKVLMYYPSSNATDTTSPLFATTGDSGPTAINQSNIDVGQQQRADNIYAETTFVCPSYWLAEAFSDSSNGQGKAYKYQFSVLPALHGYDAPGYFDPVGQAPFSASFSIAFQQIWGNFVMNSNPSISQSVAIGQVNGTAPAQTQGGSSGQNPATDWPPYSIYSPYQIDLNQTGGEFVPTPTYLVENFTAQTGQGATNDFRLVNAYTWEGGRGVRCDFWRSVGLIVPE